MKKIISVTLVLGLTLLSIIEVAGQHPNGKQNFAEKKETLRGRQGMQGWEGRKHKLQLSDEQKVQVRELKRSQMKQNLAYWNTIREKTAQVKTLTTGEVVSFKNVDKLLDEIQAIKTQMAKDRINAKIAFRNILNEDQQAMMPAFNQGEHLKKRHNQSVKSGKLHGNRGSSRHGKYVSHHRSTKSQDRYNQLKLTGAQKEQMKSLRLERLKSMTQFKNQQDELKAKLATAMSADEVEVKSINKFLDQLGKVELEKTKNDVRHQQKVRSMLDDEQKVYFDWQRAQGKNQGVHRKG